jgi:hypothetical protein
MAMIKNSPLKQGLQRQKCRVKTISLPLKQGLKKEVSMNNQDIIIAIDKFRKARQELEKLIQGTDLYDDFADRVFDECFTLCDKLENIILGG